ncbi:MAG: hypothetical protein PHD58_11145 [Anaerolineales bacterium]|nr:hypothetical protein [Anaerolineales bacterium]
MILSRHPASGVLKVFAQESNTRRNELSLISPDISAFPAGLPHLVNAFWNAVRQRSNSACGEQLPLTTQV